MKILSPVTIGTFGYYMGQVLYKTLRITTAMHPSVQLQSQYVYGFWHDKQLVPILTMAKWGDRKHVGLVSPSRDGQILSTWLTYLGYLVVRGSSSRKAISGLVQLLAAMKKGYSAGIAADGPRGPRHQAKAGVSFVAYKSGSHVVPLGVAYQNKWQFKSWDQYQLPLPFSRCVLYLGEPIAITDMNDVEGTNEKIAQAINAAERKAAQILSSNSVLAKSEEAISASSYSNGSHNE